MTCMCGRAFVIAVQDDKFQPLQGSRIVWRWNAPSFHAVLPGEGVVKVVVANDVNRKVGAAIKFVSNFLMISVRVSEVAELYKTVGF